MIAFELKASDYNIDLLGNLSRDITSGDVDETIPIHYDEATAEGITHMLENYEAFLLKKEALLNQYQAYLAELRKLLSVARQYHDKTKADANKILKRKGMDNFRKALSKAPQIRTKGGMRSCGFFKIKSK